MKITKIESGPDRRNLIAEILTAFAESRFNVRVGLDGKGGVSIQQVRLKEKKEYCGNHPKACERPHSGKHRKMTCLEGADWVEFNEALNDLLDRLEVSAQVSASRTSGCIIRKGNRRRIEYRADKQLFDGTWQWNYDDPEDCWSSGPQPSRFPSGTPGIYTPTGYACVG